jgi:hypothetical protein
VVAFFAMQSFSFILKFSMVTNLSN